MLDQDLNKPYAAWFIPKFLAIFRKSCLMLKCLKIMIISLKITEEEKNVLIEMFYNKKKAIAFLFEEIDMIKSDVGLLQEIRIISHKTW